MRRALPLAMMVLAVLVAGGCRQEADKPEPTPSASVAAAKTNEMPEAPPYSDADLVVAAELEERLEREITGDNYKQKLAEIEQALGIASD